MKRVHVPWLILSVVVLGVLSVMTPMSEPQRTNGCLWDYDTLAAEAKGLPATTEIYTGRFDRFPPLYYEMRLARVSEEMLTTPDDLDLYDNAGVSCDRLKRSDEAIEWMAKKRVVLDEMIAQGQDVSEHEYRYLANLGTFHIHRWLINGADREDMSDVEHARDLIAGAIDLNPDAHFGRERYQLLAIEWILIDTDEWPTQNLFQVLNIPSHDPNPQVAVNKISNNSLALHEYGDAVAGLTGFISLGSAWQSVDIFNALVFALSDQGDGVIAELCLLRVEELLDSGRTSVSLNFEACSPVGPMDSYVDSSILPYYKKARAEADQWSQARNEYITAKLLNGEHPDTNPEFWNDWKEITSPPRFPIDIGRKLLTKPALVIIVVLTGIALLYVRDKLKSKQPDPA